MDNWNVLNICEHQNTQSVTHAFNSWTDINWERKSSLAQNQKQKSHERQNAPLPHLLFYRMEDGFIFHRILSKIVLVNLSVFSKYINQPSVKSAWYCATKFSRNEDSCRKFVLILKLLWAFWPSLDFQSQRGWNTSNQITSPVVCEQAFSRVGNWGEGKAKRPLSPFPSLSSRFFFRKHRACSQATSPAVSLTKNNGRIVSLSFQVFDLK